MSQRPSTSTLVSLVFRSLSPPDKPCNEAVPPNMTGGESVAPEYVLSSVNFIRHFCHNTWFGTNILPSDSHFGT